MAHYAFISPTGMVASVIVGKDEKDLPPGISSWEQYYGQLEGMRCLRTSYNTRGGVHYDPETGQPSEDQSKAFRMNYAGYRYAYDDERDAFIPPKPFESWVLDEATCLWQAPIPYPNDGGAYRWDESLGDWVEVV